MDSEFINVKETSYNINYWKEIEDELPDILKNLNGVIMLTHNSIEFTNIMDFLNKINPGEFLNVLYISLTRSYNYMKTALEQKPLDQKRMIFIDCVSGYAFPVEDNVDEAYYHKPPQNLEKLKKITHFGIEKSNPDIVVLDSLSQFINFSKPTVDELNDLYNFLQSIKKDSLNIVQNTFVLLYDSKLGFMHNLPKSAVDLILKLEVNKE